MKHIWVFAGLLPLVVTGCTAECMLTDDGTARVCVTDGWTECGNGVQEAGETCDDGDVLRDD